MNSTRIASLLRSNAWMLNLVFVAMSSYFVANAINAVVARGIRQVPSIDDAPPPAVMPMTNTSRHHLEVLAERNLMGLKREQLDPAAGDNAAPEQPAFDGDHWTEDQLQSCTLGSTLRATLVADEPAWSMAVLVNNNTHDPTVFSINQGSNQIADDATLMAIRSREIVVRRRDHFEKCIGEGENAAPAPPPMPGVPPPMNSDEPPAPVPGDMTGVTKVSATDYNVERTEVDRVLSNLNEVATQARIVPSFKNGKANGFKLFSIKPGSIYSKIGLENGDIIQKINGYDMNSPDRALEIYTKLRDATQLTIDIQRRGSNTTMNYAIR